MGSFDEFMLYLQNHVSEIAYDTARSFRESDLSGCSLSEKDCEIITGISMSVTATYLKFYHSWLSENSEK